VIERVPARAGITDCQKLAPSTITSHVNIGPQGVFVQVRS
jgi:hypothetical protein